VINRLNFEGYIEKIIFRNSQVVKFTVVNQVKGKTKKITATLFNRDDLVMLFNSVDNLLGRLVVVVGEIYEQNYKDKKTNEWINTYCVQVDKIVER
jgi:hypothetical protein